MRRVVSTASAFLVVVVLLQLPFLPVAEAARVGREVVKSQPTAYQFSEVF